jgi:O-antigen/teichoic acid export membrane protein
MVSGLLRGIVASLRQHKLSQDIAYSLCSFVVLALSGIVINITITALRDAAALGVFNLAYAVYIVASQIATWGLHYSVLRHGAYHADDARERSELLGTAALCALVFGCFAACLLWWAQPMFARAFSSEAAGAAVAYSATGLVLFPLNKVLLAYLNALRRMRAYAVLQALRYILVMIGVAVVAASDWPAAAATVSFVVAEAVTCFLVLGFIARARLSQWPRFDAAWCRRHLVFGSKSLPAGMFTEVNSRIDVLMIGVFLNDRAVGIYSFAAMLVDGAYHVLAMVRLNFNPVLVTALKRGDQERLRTLRSLSARYAVLSTLALSIGLVGAYLVADVWIVPGKGLAEGLPSLLILLLGLNLIATWIPFDNLMLVSGHPGFQTLQQMMAVAVNVAAAVWLLPLWGLAGAATGTALSYVTGIAVLIVLARYKVGWHLLFNTFRN